MANFPRRELKVKIDEALGPSEPVAERVEAIRDSISRIDQKVPPIIMRITQHLHNLIYIRFFYEQIGQQPPIWIKGEMSRAERALIDELELEEGQGGLLHRSDK